MSSHNILPSYLEIEMITRDRESPEVVEWDTMPPQEIIKSSLPSSLNSEADTRDRESSGVTEWVNRTILYNDILITSTQKKIL